MDKKQNSLEIFWEKYRKSILLIFVGGGIDTIGFISLFGFFTNHVTGNLVMAGAGLFSKDDPGLWIKICAIPLFILTVIVTKFCIDRMNKIMNKDDIIYRLFLAEAFFLILFMMIGISFTPFEHAGTLHVGITAAFGLIALAIRNTSGKTLIEHLNPGTVMTGTTTAFGINITNYLQNRSTENWGKLKSSMISVFTFIFGALMGAFLYHILEFWSIAFFIPGVFGLAYLSKKGHFFLK